MWATLCGVGGVAVGPDRVMAFDSNWGLSEFVFGRFAGSRVDVEQLVAVRDHELAVGDDC